MDRTTTVCGAARRITPQTLTNNSESGYRTLLFPSQPIFSPFAASFLQPPEKPLPPIPKTMVNGGSRVLSTRSVTCHITFVLLQPATSYLAVTVTKLPGAIWIVPPKPSRSSRPILTGFNWLDMVLARPKRVSRRYRLPRRHMRRNAVFRVRLSSSSVRCGHLSCSPNDADWKCEQKTALLDAKTGSRSKSLTKPGGLGTAVDPFVAPSHAVQDLSPAHTVTILAPLRSGTGPILPFDVTTLFAYDYGGLD